MHTVQTNAGIWHIDHGDLASQFLAEENCLNQRLPETLGSGHSNVFKLDDDFSFIETRFAPSRDLAVASKMAEHEPKMVVTLGLQGHSGFTGKHGESLAFKEGYTSITTFNSSEGYRQYQGNRDVAQLRLSIGRRWLANCFGDNLIGRFFDRSETRMLSQRPISAEAVVAAQGLLHCRLAGNAMGLYRQGQAMAILASELSHLLADAPPNSSKFSPRDRDTAHAARDILAAEYRNPPSVAELSRRTGTNQCKLKQLFHHFFATTPYGLLLEIRMRKAYELLKSSQYTVGGVAEQVGYNHASNFSAAFVKRFGFPPKQLSRLD